MGYSLREGVTFCEIVDRLVFLDVLNDRYFCLEVETDRVFRFLTGHKPLSAEDRFVLADLVEQGLLKWVHGGARPQALPPPILPKHSLIDEDLPASSAALAHALWHIARTTLEFKVRPLRAIVASTRHRKAKVEPGSDASAQVVDVAGAFKRSSLISAPFDRCLQRSFAIANALLDRKVRPDLVFGVRLHPFAAHCWVQLGRTLVNETLDQARNFTPILVI